MTYHMRDFKNVPVAGPSSEEVAAMVAGSLVTVLGFGAFILFFLSLGA